MAIAKKPKERPRAAKTGRYRLWRWVKDNVESLKIILLMVAGLFALAEYKSKDYIDRVKSSADIIEKYLASDEHKAHMALDEFRWSSEYLEQQKQLSQKIISSQQFREFVAAEVKSKHSSNFMKAIRGIKQFPCARFRVDASH